MAEPYRSDVDAIAEQLRQVEEELGQIARAAARRDALTREAALLKARLQAARARGPLEDLRIASPCRESWEDMVGDERVRHCAGCRKDVYNVSGMTRADAIELVRSRSQKELCLRMYRRTDGTVLTADCAVGMQRKRVRRLAMVGAGVAAGVAGSLWAVSATMVMGDIGPAEGGRMGDAEQGQSTGFTRSQPHAMGSALPPTPGSAAPLAPPSAPAKARTR